MKRILFLVISLMICVSLFSQEPVLINSDISKSKIEGIPVHSLSNKEYQEINSQDVAVPKEESEISQQGIAPDYMYLTLELLLVTDIKTLNIDEESKKALKEILLERENTILDGQPTFEIDDKITRSLIKNKIIVKK